MRYIWRLSCSFGTVVIAVVGIRGLIFEQRLDLCCRCDRGFMSPSYSDCLWIDKRQKISTQTCFQCFDISSLWAALPSNLIVGAICKLGDQRGYNNDDQRRRQRPPKTADETEATCEYAPVMSESRTRPTARFGSITSKFSLSANNAGYSLGPGDITGVGAVVRL